MKKMKMKMKMKMRVKPRQTVPNVFTMAALFAGVGSVLASGSGHFLLAAQLILVSLILDGLDGTVARWLDGQTAFGAELDTFVDITSFGMAPAALLYFHPQGLQLLPVHWGVLVACLTVASGASRLSRFRVVDPYRGQRGYLGLPITGAAGFAAAYVIGVECVKAAWRMPEGWAGWVSLAKGPLAELFWAGFVLMLVLQVSKVRYGKPTKNPVIFIPFFVGLVLLFVPPAATWVSLAMMGYTLWYALISPFFFARFLAHLPPLPEEAAGEEGSEGAEGAE